MTDRAGGAAQRIVIRGLNWLGDSVMSAPALARLREALPESHIALLCSEWLAPLWEGHPAINQTLTFSRRESIWRRARRLREERFDTAIISPNSFRAALEIWLAGIPRRIGRPTNGRGFLLTDKVSAGARLPEMRKRTRPEISRLLKTGCRSSPPPLDAHHLHRYLELVRPLGVIAEPVAPFIPVSGDEARLFRRDFGLLETGEIWGLCPGAEYGPAKRWPAGRFIEAAAKIQAGRDIQWIVFGGPKEAELATAIAEGIATGAGFSKRSSSQVINAAGKTTLRQLCAGLRVCHCVVTNDTGPMHLAAAVGARVIAIFGSTSPEFTSPGLPGERRHQIVRAQAPCAPCFLPLCPIDFRCMREIEVETVVAAAQAGF